MASGTDGFNSSGQQALDRFAQMMIERMERMKASDWRQGWIGGASSVGLPQNVTGRNYSGSNSFFLQLHSAIEGLRASGFPDLQAGAQLQGARPQRREGLSRNILGYAGA